MAETSSTTAGAQTLLRGLAVLNAVYNGCHDLKSIGEFTGTTRSTTHRLVTVLVEQRYLRHVPTQGYQLGAKLIEFGARAPRCTKLPSPFCNALPVTPWTPCIWGSLKATKCCIWRRSTVSAGWKCAHAQAIACHWQSPASARH